MLTGKVEVPKICMQAQRVTGPVSLSFGALGRFDNAEKSPDVRIRDRVFSTQ